MALTILYCVSTEKQFGIVLLVMCKVALQSKSAQIVAQNVYREAPLNHNSYTTESLYLAL